MFEFEVIERIGFLNKKMKKAKQVKPQFKPEKKEETKVIEVKKLEPLKNQTVPKSDLVIKSDWESYKIADENENSDINNSDTSDFMSLLTNSYDLTRAISQNNEEILTENKNNLKLNDIFSLNTAKLADGLRSEAFCDTFFDEKTQSNYFNQELLEVFKQNEALNRNKFLSVYNRNGLIEKQQNDSAEPSAECVLEKQEESKINQKRDSILKSHENDQNIDDWLDELIS